MTPEGKVKAAVKKICKQYVNVHFIMIVPGGFGTAGVHDFLICANGRFISVECKATEDDDATPLQVAFATEVTTAGGIALLIHARNLDLLNSYLMMAGAVKK